VFAPSPQLDVFDEISSLVLADHRHKIVQSRHLLSHRLLLVPLLLPHSGGAQLSGRMGKLLRFLLLVESFGEFSVQIVAAFEGVQHALVLLLLALSDPESGLGRQLEGTLSTHQLYYQYRQRASLYHIVLELRVRLLTRRTLFHRSELHLLISTAPTHEQSFRLPLQIFIEQVGKLLSDDETSKPYNLYLQGED
jgi:hypothetical protein